MANRQPPPDEQYPFEGFRVDHALRSSNKTLKEAREVLEQTTPLTDPQCSIGRRPAD